MHYRRVLVPGATYFFTVNLADRRSRLLVDQVEGLRAAVRQVKVEHPFEIDAWVVLPEHLHAVWTLPPGDCAYPMRWNQIRGAFSRRLGVGESISPSRTAKRERGIWQRRYWEHLIRDEDDLARHIAYVHINPVKHGYVQRAADWPFSSLQRYIRLGWVAADWGSDPGFDAGYGERSEGVS